MLVLVSCIFKTSLTLRQSLKPATVTKVPKVSSLPIGNWNVKVHRPLSENMKKIKIKIVFPEFKGLFHILYPYYSEKIKDKFTLKQFF